MLRFHVLYSFLIVLLFASNAWCASSVDMLGKKLYCTKSVKTTNILGDEEVKTKIVDCNATLKSVLDKNKDSFSIKDMDARNFKVTVYYDLDKYKDRAELTDIIVKCEDGIAMKSHNDGYYVPMNEDRSIDGPSKCYFKDQASAIERYAEIIDIHDIYGISPFRKSIYDESYVFNNKPVYFLLDFSDIGKLEESYKKIRKVFKSIPFICMDKESTSKNSWPQNFNCEAVGGTLISERKYDRWNSAKYFYVPDSLIDKYIADKNSEGSKQDLKDKKTRKLKNYRYL